MKETIFQSSKMFCNTKRADSTSMGEKYGAMTSEQLKSAISDAQNNSSRRHRSNPENRYLKSIHATCRNLPHSNEAAAEARKVYFSYCIRFGLPCIFLTISPDDQRNFRVVVYAIEGREYAFGQKNVADMEDSEVLADFKVRQKVRGDYPGLCAEEYGRIMDLVIKHLFGWDEANTKSEKIGLFGKVLAWCIATEEQGRKSLHGHILLFMKDWATVLDALHRRNNEVEEILSYTEAARVSKRFYKNACSANLFADFSAPNGVMCRQPVFHHDPCRKRRRPEEVRFTVNPVEDQTLRQMRHKRLCREHQGHIANCPKCKRRFTVKDIVENALNHHLDGSPERAYEYPDWTKRLDRNVFEMHKHFEWNLGSDYEKARHYFASNALVNIHSVTHANRCFKKGAECYANLPDAVMEELKIFHNTDFDVWSNHLGEKTRKYMFRFYPRRNIEDVFMNTHNPDITALLGCNNNVLFGMNGCAVFYVTGYNCKSQQKEERAVFNKVSEVVVRLLEKHVSPTIIRFACIQNSSLTVWLL